MIQILTERKYNKGISRQVVYEWENDFAEAFNCEFKYLDSYIRHPVARFYRKIGLIKPISWHREKCVYIFFAMNIDLLKLVTWFLPNVLPILLDVSLDDVDNVYLLTKNLPIFWVTSYRICQEIKTKYPDSNVEYIAQTVSKSHIDLFSEKEIDFIQFGRRNPFLHEWAMRYCDEHEGRCYMYRHLCAKDGMVIYKNREKKEIGEVQSRQEFIDFLQKCKISLCSTPLMDATRDFGEGIDFLTARWFESVACKCYIIARWSDMVHEEVAKTGLNKVADNVISYEMFRNIADRYLGERDVGVQREQKIFLDNNMAFNRANQIREQLQFLNIY